MLGKIIKIEEIFDVKLQGMQKIEGKNGSRLGMSGMIQGLMGFSSMDGYKVKTDKHDFYVLIENGQSCCEDWGYFSSEDDFDKFIGQELKEIKMTDKALNEIKFKESNYYEDDGGIQFVDFITDKDVFQLAVYNAHNGYYGHGILIAKDKEIILNDTL